MVERGAVASALVFRAFLPPPPALSLGERENRAQSLSMVEGRAVASALVFRAFLPPHPALSLGEGESCAALECFFDILSAILPIHQYETSRLGFPLRLGPAHRVMSQFAGRAEVELALHVHAMHFDGLGAEVEAAGHVARAETFADELEDFKLAVAQLFHRRTFRPGAMAGEDGENFRGHLVAHIDSPFQDLA